MHRMAAQDRAQDVNTRISELPNELTTNIDSSGPTGIVRMLRQTDGQLFSGWGKHPCINDDSILTVLDQLANKTSQLLKENQETGANNLFIFTGCGTSGRIAWVCCQLLNQLLSLLGQRPCVRYLIAGGDKALIVGDELPEDDPPRGASDLKQITEGCDKAMVFGITCGLSAPYVAGQIDLALQQTNLIPVLVGFNPVELARHDKIEKWHKTCCQTFLELAVKTFTEDAFVLNPVVGPEAITGSSRMKGGSMTALLLETVFMAAVTRAFSIPLSRLIPGAPPTLVPTPSSLGDLSTPSSLGTSPKSDSDSEPKLIVLTEGQAQIGALVDAFDATYRAAYRSCEGIADLVAIAADSLTGDGHLYYLGSGLFGILGFIDSSEMVSTYGSSPHEVRGFVAGGWKSCANQDGDLSHRGPLYRISLDNFETDILPQLTDEDTVLWIESGLEPSSHTHLLEKVLASPANCCGLVLSTADRPLHSHTHKFYRCVHVVLPYFNVLSKIGIFSGFALKLILNAISTGANVSIGKVYHNRMINLTVANDKLYYRSFSIITDIAGVSESAALVALLKAIYREDDVKKYYSLPASAHITAATKVPMVVPLAILLAARGCTVDEALGLLADKQTYLSTILEKYRHS